MEAVVRQSELCLQKSLESTVIAEKSCVWHPRKAELTRAGWFKILSRPYDGELLPPEDKDFVSEENIFNYQAKIIKDLAEKESCVIVGRCADYVLKDNPNVVSVFVHADEKFCLDRAMERNSMTEKEMKKYIEKTDKFRGDFYRYHTGHEWADARNYDLCLNSGKLGFQKCVEEIKAYIKIRFDL